jgi:hypothetical protein
MPIAAPVGAMRARWFSLLRDRTMRPLATMRLYQAGKGRWWGRALYPLLWLLHRRQTRRAG